MATKIILALSLLPFSVTAERAYPQGCATKDPTYYDYDTMSWPPSSSTMVLDADDYQITRRLGHGKFSDVFEAVRPPTSSTNGNDDNDVDDGSSSSAYVVIKCLKPVSERKVRREVLVLQRCRHVANMVRLHGIVLNRDHNSIIEDHPSPGERQQPRQQSQQQQQHSMPALILEHAGRNAQWLCHNGNSNNSNNNKEYEANPLSDYEIRYYLCHLLVSLDGLHSVGVIHRDVKPRNVLINREPSAATPLLLIDLGLADFYVPNTRYNVRVASRHYKSPELLTGYEYYDYSIDLWGVGCILAGLLLQREPFFRGVDNFDQLGKIITLLGVPDLATFLRKYNVTVTAEVEREIGKHPPTLPRQSFWEAHRSVDAPVPPLDGMDLLQRLLVYDPDVRYTAHQALQHPYFDPVRDRVQKEVRRRRSHPRKNNSRHHQAF
jgi:casein kinase II subunit alpha